MLIVFTTKNTKNTKDTKIVRDFDQLRI